jgi:Uncharacterised ArCR, COG2043
MALAAAEPDGTEDRGTRGPDAPTLLPVDPVHAKMAICQALSLARRYGQTLAFSGEDLACPIAKSVFEKTFDR